MSRNEELYRSKRKLALIGVLTLGLSIMAKMGIKDTCQSNIFQRTSFNRGGIGFVMKVISFLLITTLCAVPYFVISFFRLIYYSIILGTAKE